MKEVKCIRDGKKAWWIKQPEFNAWNPQKGGRRELTWKVSFGLHTCATHTHSEKVPLLEYFTREMKPRVHKRPPGKSHQGDLKLGTTPMATSR